MKKRLGLFNLVFLGLFALATFALIFYYWWEDSATKLSAAEQSMLDELGAIILAGDSHFPPLSFTDDDGLNSGYEADLVYALEEWLGITVDHRQVTWSDALAALDQGEITGITGMRITDERSQIYHFSVPYWETAYCLVNYIGRDHERILSGRRLKAVMQEGSATQDYFMGHIHREGIEIVPVANAEQGFYILREGYADIWFENYQVARYEALKARMLDFFHFHTVPESVGHYALALGPEYPYLKPIFDKAMLGLEEEGVLAELDRKWFGLTDYRAEPSPWLKFLPVALYGVFTLFMLFMLWNRSLHYQVERKTEELRKSEEKFKASFEGSHDAIMITTADGRILDCNRKALDHFGYIRKEDFLKSDLKDLFPVKQPEGEDSYDLFVKKIQAALHRDIMLRFEWQHRRRDGSAFPAEVSLTVYPLGGKKVVQANVSDITERKRIQEQLEFLSLHDQLTGLFNRTFFEAELQRMSRGRFYPLTLISSDLDGLKLINDTMGHDTGDRLLVACAEVLQESLRASDVLARVGGDEFCAILPYTDQQDGEQIARRIRENMNRYNRDQVDVPLGLSLGLATAENSTVAIKDLFSQADDMMYRDKLYRSAGVRNKVVESLLAALAERDYITEGHAQRLETLCLAMGENVNLTSRQLSDLALLAKVHDLGKVGIPDHILNKPGPLTAEEWKIMKQHSEKGFRIATSSPDLTAVADLILKHHERFDGSGYPLGLREEEIPVECRILAIVDAFDAMTNDRPYARAKSVGAAVEEIESAAGSQFDPRLVGVFLEIIGDTLS